MICVHVEDGRLVVRDQDGRLVHGVRFVEVTQEVGEATRIIIHMVSHPRGDASMLKETAGK